MNVNGAVLEAEIINFPTNIAQNETTETLIEEIRIESVAVSEIETKAAGTRFARLKKVLRKRSASIL